MSQIFIELPIVNSKEKDAMYNINILNINYMRKWSGDKGELQTVVYFSNDTKYLVVDMPIEAVKARIALMNAASTIS